MVMTRHYFRASKTARLRKRMPVRRVDRIVSRVYIESINLNEHARLYAKRLMITLICSLCSFPPRFSSSYPPG